MFTEQGGDEVARKLLRANPDITAIYASSIGQGIGTIHAAWRLGLTVPDDLSVIAYDDLPLANYTVPPLTTIRVPLERLGAAGLDALAAQLAGEKPGDIVIPVEPVVVIRASTAPPATGAGRHNRQRKPRG